MRRTGWAGLVAAGLLVAGAGSARADDASDVKALVKNEIKAYMEQKKADDTKDGVFRVKWKDGLNFETLDKKYTMKIGGRIHLDTAFTSADKALQGPAPGLNDDFDSATYFRRLRIYLGGEITKYVDYFFQLDFADPSDGGLRDAYVTIKNLKECWGCWMPSVRVGQHYEPIGLETVTSDNHLTFVERAGMVSLHPERSIGLSAFDSFWKDRATAAIGIFSPDGDDDENGFAIWDEDDTDGGYAVTGRATLVPWALDTCRFVHVGASASYRNPHEVQYRARPGLGRGPRVVDTGVLNPKDLILWNAELGLVWNRLHAAAEFTTVALNDPARGDPSFTAWYVEAGWFLTGEARAYDFKKALWTNLKPCCNFLSENCCCWGAFQLAARYDVLDLTDGTVNGGQLSTLTLGLNWYLNPNTRIMFDYVLANVKDRNGPGGVVIVDTDVKSFLIRFDVHF